MTLIGVIFGRMKELGICSKDTALATHMSKPTFYKRIGSPETFTIQEIKLMSRALKIPFRDLLDAIEKQWR